MLMLDAKLRGGGERTGQWYDHLQEILNEKASVTFTQVKQFVHTKSQVVEFD